MGLPAVPSNPPMAPPHSARHAISVLRQQQLAVGRMVRTGAVLFERQREGPLSTAVSRQFLRVLQYTYQQYLSVAIPALHPMLLGRLTQQDKTRSLAAADSSTLRYQQPLSSSSDLKAEPTFWGFALQSHEHSKSETVRVWVFLPQLCMPLMLRSQQASE